MSWSGAIQHYANPFGNLVEGYQQGRKQVYDQALKAIQIKNHIQKMQIYWSYRVPL